MEDEERKVKSGSPIIQTPAGPAWGITISTRPIDWARPARDILWPELARLRKMREVN